MLTLEMDAPLASPARELDDFDAVVRQYWPRIFRFVLASTRDRDAAETIAQDCLWRAYQARSRFRGDASLNTWLIQIAINLIRDFKRCRRIQFWKRVQIAIPDSAALGACVPWKGMSPEAAAVAREQMEAVWRVSSKLSDRQRTVFLLRFVEDMDLLEICAATGLSESAVKVHLYRAVHKIREQVGAIR